MENQVVEERIKNLVNENRIMLFMKGDRQEPQCGFSAQVIQILNQYEVNYHTENVLADWSIREGIKTFSNWPTIPQLYVDGKFIGGCDITMELHRKEELGKILEK